MSEEILNRRTVAEIKRRLYDLATVEPALELLAKAGQDTTALDAQQQHLRENFKAYLAFVGVKEE